MVLSFSSQAIKKEEELSIAPSKIKIFSQQEEPWCQQLVLLVAVASMTYQFVFSQLFFGLNAFSAGWQLEQRREDECISS